MVHELAIDGEDLLLDGKPTYEGRFNERGQCVHIQLGAGNWVPREIDFEKMSGFRSPPVNWGINTPQKRAFFERVRALTGGC